jgi:hypothetical protein
MERKANRKKIQTGEQRDGSYEARQLGLIISHVEIEINL